MKKLLIAILLSIGLALGGGWTGCAKNPGMESTIPDMQYDEIDFFKDGKAVIKVPAYIDATSDKWMLQVYPIIGELKSAVFTNQDFLKEKVTVVVNVKQRKVFLIAYNDGATALDFYIYDGKQYPTKTTEEAARAYMKLITEKEST